MDIKDIILYWKPIVSAAVAIVVATVAVVTWAKDLVQEEVDLMNAKNALAHDYYFQQSRIDMKEIEIAEHQRELNKLYKYIGDDEPTPLQLREIQYLEDEIHDLREDIEEIKEQLADAHE